MFKKIRSEELKDYRGCGTLYRHDKTGMEVFHLKNESRELACCFMFSTPARDDMGVAHIIEHTVLCGSKRYPVKDPFSQVLLSSPNTFLNAMTYLDKTVYPFASPLKKDFDILFGIYSDAVFDPLLRRESFEQEGVRFFDSSFDGVVYNEMTGALSSADDIAQSYCMRDLFEGTPFMYESGGNPLFIADLTYEEYIARYKDWYSPSNCRLFLFGNLNPEEYMEKIERLYLSDEKLASFSGKVYSTSASGYPLKDKFNLRTTKTCPQSDCSSSVLTWLTKPSEDMLELLTLTVLVDILLGDPGAPLYKAICDSGLGEDLNPLSGTDPDIALMPFIAGFTGCGKHSEDEIESFIISTLKNIAENGLDPEQVEAAVRRQDFRLHENNGSGEPLGINAALKSARTWLRNGKPEDALKSSEVLEVLKRKIKEGRYFENWISENLVNNHRRCLLSVKYDGKYNEKLKNQIEEKYKKRISAEDPKSFEMQKKEFSSFIASEDSEDSLATIERIRITDLPEEIPTYRTVNEKIGNTTLLKYSLFTNGIVYLNMSFATPDLSEEDKKLLFLLMRIMQMTGTDRYDYVKLGTLFKKYTGSFYINSICASKTDGSVSSDVTIKTKVMKDDLKTALDLIENLITHADVSDPERIKASLTDIETEFEMNYTYSANVYANLYACSKFSVSSKETETVSGTSAWLYYKKLKAETKDYSDLGVKLEMLKKRVFNNSGFVCLVGTDEENMGICRNEVVSFIEKIPQGPDAKPEKVVSKSTEKQNTFSVLKLSSGPAYNALAVPLEEFNSSELTHAMLFASSVSSTFLWDLVRGKNGAYGVYGSADLQEKFMTFVSYRDPSVDKTFDAFEKAFEAELDSREIEYSVVTIIGKELKPLTPQQKCNAAFRRFLYDMTEELYLERRKTLLETKPEDLRKIAAKLQKAYRKSSYRVSICSGELADSCKNCETVVLPL